MWKGAPFPPRATSLLVVPNTIEDERGKPREALGDFAPAEMEGRYAPWIETDISLEMKRKQLTRSP
jgi:hypothetical protein